MQVIINFDIYYLLKLMQILSLRLEYNSLNELVIYLFIVQIIYSFYIWTDKLYLYKYFGIVYSPWYYYK